MFSKAVRDAKQLYAESLQHQFSNNDSASVWRGFRQITSYKPKSPQSMNDSRLANKLNQFYCHFKRQWDRPDTVHRHTTDRPQSMISSPSLTILERDVNRLFRRQKPRKAAGPDSVSTSTLKHCANQLSPVFRHF